jgi:hypothetical protein
MFTLIRAHWSKFSTGLLLATFVALGGVEVYQHLGGDCCGLGMPCCHPGSSCCHHDAQAHPLALR